MPTATAEPAALVPVTRRDKVQVIENAIDARRSALMEVMPEGLTPARFIRNTLIAIGRNPDLLDCTVESIISAVFDAAEAGLTPTGALNRAWLVPFNENIGTKQKPKYEKRAKLMIGYQGLSDLARRSGDVSTIISRAVFEGDQFEVSQGTDEYLRHVPALTTSDPEKMTHVYAVAVMRDGSRVFEPMTKKQIDDIRSASRSGNSPAWTNSYVQMARKTVIRRLANSLPLTEEAASAIQHDDEREAAAAPAIPAESATSKARAALAARLGNGAQPSQDGQGAEIEGEAADVTADGITPEDDEALDALLDETEG